MYFLMPTRLLLLALLALSMTAHAEMFTWKDAEGHTHFGDQPPPELREQAEPIEAKARPPGSDQATREVYERANRLFDATRKVQDKAKGAEAKTAAESSARCREARDRERTLAGRVVFTDENGKEYTVTEPERKRRLQEQRDWISANCP